MEEKYIQILAETSERAKSNTHQIEEIKEELKDIKEENKALNKIATSVELIAQDMTHVKSDINDVKQSQSEMKDELATVKNESNNKKAQWFDNIGKMVITAFATGIIAFILGTICPVVFK